MSVNVIDTIKPKNGGSFPVVEAADVSVGAQRLPAALAEKAGMTDLAALEAEIDDKASSADIRQLRNEIALKASQSSLDATNVVVASKAAQSSLDALSVVVERKADKRDYDNIYAEIDKKADKTAVENIKETLMQEDVNLQNQIDQIEISASAEAVVAPEVVAARVGADSTSYSTLKERLDAENNAIKAEFVDFTGIIYVTLIGQNALDNKAYNATGELVDNDNVVAVKKLIIANSRSIECSSDIKLYALFDENDSFLERIALGQATSSITITNDSAKYVGLMFSKDTYTADNIRASTISGVCKKSETSGIVDDIATINAIIDEAEVGVDSYPYNSLKSRLDTENLNIKADIGDFTGSHYITVIGQHAIDMMAYAPNGSLVPNESIVSTDKMKLLSSARITCSSKIALYASFDKNGSFIERVDVDPDSNTLEINDEDVKYVALMFNRNNYSYQTIQESTISGVYEEKADTSAVLEVGTGKEYTKVIDALWVAAGITDRKVEINIYDGEYDLYEELGGDEYVSEISSTASWSSGIQPVLTGDVKINGIGDVKLKMLIPSEVKAEYSHQATRLSAINTKGSLELNNIEIECANNRYCVHDECDNNDSWKYSKHKYSNCRFKSTSGLHCVGIGTSHATYEFDKCYFITDTGSALYIHGWSTLLGADISITDCVLSTSAVNGHGINLSVNSANTSKVYIASSYCNDIYISTENASTYTANVYEIIGLNTNVSGVVYASAIVDRSALVDFYPRAN